MKKFLGIVVLGLLWCSNANALPKCQGTYGSLLSWAWTNCYGKAIFDDGGSYEGEFYNEKAHGNGIFIFSNGDRVEGEFNNGIPHGWAKMTRTDGSKYIGEFYKGEFHGEGTYWYPDGVKMEGEFKNGNIDGHVTATKTNGEVRYAIFKNGEFVKEVNYSDPKKNNNDNNDNVAIGSKLIFKDCKLSPNYDPGTTITVDLSQKVIKITEPEGTSEYYDVKTVYGDLIVSSNIKFASGISDNDLNAIKSILAMELKLDTGNKTVAITWDLLNGSGKMYNFFKKQFKTGKKERFVSSKCKLENL
tara:strand:+ start:388 stop:1293 length:906 start_codon:yes stop_codon:yes gene_type:complete